MDDVTGSGSRAPAPYFPAPRARMDAHSPFREAAPGVQPVSRDVATGIDAAPAARAGAVVVTRPSEAPSEPMARRPATLPPYHVTDAEIRSEIMRGSIDTSPLFFGRSWFRALLLTRPKWTGAVLLIAGLAMLGNGILTHHVTVGPAAIFTGIGWILCDRVPITRPGRRWLAIAGVMFAGLFFEFGLEALGWIKK